MKNFALRIGKPNKIRQFTIVCGLLLSFASVGQSVRFSFQMGAAIPTQQFAMSSATPDSGGFANTGFDIRMVAERIYKDHRVVGFNVGYSVFGLDQSQIQKNFNPSNPDAISVESQSFQNVSIQGRVGYEFKLLEEKLQIVPLLELGVGIFNSAYYLIEDNLGNTFIRSGNTDISFLLSPGLEVWVPLNNFTNIKLYSSYQLATFDVDESFTYNSGPPTNSTINYSYSSLLLGAGITISF